MTDTTLSARLVLEMAIQTEKDGRALYLQASLGTNDEQGRALFVRLADDELEHLALLESQLASLNRDGTWQPAPELSSAQPSTPIFDRKLSAGEVNRLTSDLTALRMAALIERDAVVFYTRAARKIRDPQGKSTFEALAEMEQSHYDLLRGEYVLLAEQFKLTMGFEPF